MSIIFVYDYVQVCTIIHENIEGELKGKTPQVYLYMLKRNEPVGVREVQRDLDFSSPSVASYHLDKLISLI
jgi:transcriptional regulator, ArsR family